MYNTLGRDKATINIVSIHEGMEGGKRRGERERGERGRGRGREGEGGRERGKGEREREKERERGGSW